MEINRLMNRLIKYGLDQKLITENDATYIANQIIAFLRIDEFIQEDIKSYDFLADLNGIYQYAKIKGLISGTQTDHEIFNASFMNLFTQRPSEIQREFIEHYQNSPKEATNFFHDLCLHNYYIQFDKIAKNIKWNYDSEYGNIKMSINLSKPEKDPKEIALAKKQKANHYPRCQLCVENVGYLGTMNHPARSNLRTIPLIVNHDHWHFQYSPYSYFNEHCILLAQEHKEMKLQKASFENMVDFIRQFPHYFIGSNADLPIVGGSILTHDHYQGGNDHFPVEDARIVKQYEIRDDLTLSIVDWPLATLRLQSKNPQTLVDYADVLYRFWQGYSDESVDIIAYTTQPHNTVTPVVRYKNGYFEMDLFLRNNRTSTQYPDGIFHAHMDIHPIKKENLGLIEVMGLAILPARLHQEFQLIQRVLEGEVELMDEPSLTKHTPMIKRLQTDVTNNPHSLILAEAARMFVKGLEDAGVFKKDPSGKAAYHRFIDAFIHSL